VIKLMRANLKPSSFRMWRKRVTSGNARKSIKPQITDPSDDES